MLVISISLRVRLSITSRISTSNLNTISSVMHSMITRICWQSRCAYALTPLKGFHNGMQRTGNSAVFEALISFRPMSDARMQSVGILSPAAR
jgi:hypothetical protein